MSSLLTRRIPRRIDTEAMPPHRHMTACPHCRSKGCAICGGSGWVTVIDVPALLFAASAWFVPIAALIVLALAVTP